MAGNRGLRSHLSELEYEGLPNPLGLTDKETVTSAGLSYKSNEIIRAHPLRTFPLTFQQTSHSHLNFEDGVTNNGTWQSTYTDLFKLMYTTSLGLEN